jgi:hypothetical protein
LAQTGAGGRTHTELVLGDDGCTQRKPDLRLLAGQRAASILAAIPEHWRR